MKRHERLHQEPLPFHCDIDVEYCNRAFRKKSQLKDHITKSHSYGANFACTEDRCNCTFTLEAELDLHIKKKHVNKRRHACQEEGCWTVFDHFSQLKAHTTEMHKPICSICGFTAKARKLLKAHLKTHETELQDRRQYCCDIEGCPAKFTRVNRLIYLYCAKVYLVICTFATSECQSSRSATVRMSGMSSKIRLQICASETPQDSSICNVMQPTAQDSAAKLFIASDGANICIEHDNWLQPTFHVTDEWLWRHICGGTVKRYIDHAFNRGGERVNCFNSDPSW